MNSCATADDSSIVTGTFMPYLDRKHYNRCVLVDLILPAVPAKSRSALFVLGGALAAVGLSTWLGYWLRIGLATTGSIYLVVVVVTAVYGRFWTATAISVVAVSCLNYFFVAPIFTFTVTSAEDKVALLVFEFTALVVSRLSDTANLRAAEAIAERRDSQRLYEVARRILLLDRSRDPGELLTSMIRDAFEFQAVVLFDAPAGRMYTNGISCVELEEGTREAHARAKTMFEAESATWYCVLHVDARPIGGLALSIGSRSGTRISPMLADALASLCAVALERYRSLDRELRAEAIRQCEQLRGAVLDTLGHEFKTPVTTIWAASSGLLESGGLSTMQAELLTLVDEQSRKLNDLASRLLRTAKLDRADFKPKRKPLLLSDVVDSVLQDLEPQQSKERIQVKPPREEVFALGDPSLIGAAVTQLVDNALKYSTPGSAIHIWFGGDDGEATITVHSTGVVIQQADRERIFERFFRAEHAEHGPTGTGLGLSIVKRVVEAHHGRVWVDSDPERGTAFSVGLPVAVGANRETASRLANLPELEGTGPFKGSAQPSGTILARPRARGEAAEI
jgi:two-component system sensor histidine kinase KdpD